MRAEDFKKYRERIDKVDSFFRVKNDVSKKSLYALKQELENFPELGTVRVKTNKKKDAIHLKHNSQRRYSFMQTGLSPEELVLIAKIVTSELVHTMEGGEYPEKYIKKVTGLNDVGIKEMKELYKATRIETSELVHTMLREGYRKDDIKEHTGLDDTEIKEMKELYKAYSRIEKGDFNRVVDKSGLEESEVQALWGIVESRKIEKIEYKRAHLEKIRDVSREILGKTLFAGICAGIVIGIGGGVAFFGLELFLATLVVIGVAAAVNELVFAARDGRAKKELPWEDPTQPAVPGHQTTPNEVNSVDLNSRAEGMVQKTRLETDEKHPDEEDTQTKHL